MEGKPSSTADASGRPLAQLIQNALQGKDEGIVTYLFPKPGQVQPQSKISYVARFAPWQVVLFAAPTPMIWTPLFTLLCCASAQLAA